MKKLGICAVGIGFLMSSIPSASAAISVSTVAKLTVSKSGTSWSAAGLNTTTFTEGQYDALLQVRVYQNGNYLVDRKDTFQKSPANLGKTATTSDGSNSITCYAFAAVNGKTDSDEKVHRF